MIRFKNNPGFTLIEVLIALAIMALLLTPLFVTQGTIFQALATSTVNLRRILVGENFLADARIEAGDKQKFSFDKKIDDPITELNYKSTLVKDKSVFKDIDDIVTEKVTISWQEGNKKRQDVLISFLYKPKPEKNESKDDAKKGEKNVAQKT